MKEEPLIDNTRGAVIGISVMLIWCISWMFIAFLFDKYNNYKNKTRTELVSENKNQ